MLLDGIVPKEYQRFDSTKEELFEDTRVLKGYYDDAENFPGGAIGLFSYLNRIKAGVQQLMALNRKFSLDSFEREDVVALGQIAKDTLGLKGFEDMAKDSLKLF